MFNEKTYREELLRFLSEENLITANKAYFDKLNYLSCSLKDMITSNADDLKGTSVTYYVSNNGNDSFDGLSADSPFRTIEHLNTLTMDEGCLVLFRRGDIFREQLLAQSGVSYSAYGTGPKPKIFAAYDGKSDAMWVKTERENIWCFDKTLPDADIATIVVNDGEKYGEKRFNFLELKNQLDFVFCSNLSEEEPNQKLYVYSTDNPAEFYKSIDISRKMSIINMPNHSHDIRFKNIEFGYGHDVFDVICGKNISMSYCVCGWSGGSVGWADSPRTRYGSGMGAWLSCDNICIDHCYIYQQFDAAVSPQYRYDKDEFVGIFKNYSVTDCLFEKNEYTLEFFHTQPNFIGNGIENLYFGYNLCLSGGQGFGDKTERSCYIKMWDHENVCRNCKIEHNVFDRSTGIALEITGHADGKSGDEVSYEHIPKLKNNVYIEKKDKTFAVINKIAYKFNEASFITLQKLGVDTDSKYIFSE